MTVLATVFAIVVVNAKRDELGRTLVNRWLADSDIVATELSVTSASPDRIEFSRLVFAQGSTTYRLSDVAVDIDIAERWANRITAQRLDIERGPSAAPAAPIGPVIRSALDTLQNLRPVELEIRTIRADGLPPLTQTVLARIDDELRVAFGVSGFEVSGLLGFRDNESLSWTASLRAPDDSSAAQADAELSLSADNVDIAGRIELPGAFIDAALADREIPVDLESIADPIVGDFTIAADSPAPGSFSFDLQVAVPDDIPLAEVGAGITVSAVHDLNVSLVYPALDWRVAASQVDAELRRDGLPATSLDFSDIDCNLDGGCRANARVATGATELGTTTVASLVGQSEVRFNWRDSKHSIVLTEAEMRATDLESGAVAAAAITATLRSDVEYLPDESNARLPEVSFDWRAETVRAELASVGTLTESFDGSATLREVPDAIELDIDVQPRTGMPVGPSIQLRRDSSGERLSAEIDGITLDFEGRRLSAWFTDWQQGWDLLAGRMPIEAVIEADLTGRNAVLTGNASTSFQNVSGSVNDIAFIGLDGEPRVGIDPAAGLTVDPFDATIELLDVGLPVEDISVRLSYVDAGKMLHVGDLEMRALGGDLSAEAFEYSTGDRAATINLYADSVQLSLIVGLLELDSVSASGTVSGRVPVRIQNGKVTVDAGRLENLAGGGTVQVAGGQFDPGAIAGNGGLETVTRSLENFEFETLATDVQYSDEGDLELNVRMRGINPDIDPNQPIILNLNVENNIPQLLRSLQAVRSIEDILGRRVQD